MAVIREAGVELTGTVRDVQIDESDGRRYLIAQVENDDGISDVRFSAQETETHSGVARGELVAWVVRPWLVSGVSKRTGRPYAFLHLNYVRDAK